MELSELKKHKEVKRSRIEPPNDPNSYCEKNWMPVIDMPYHFVKWANPTELVKVDPKTNTSETVILKEGVGQHQNLRGGSQIIPYGDDRICIIHEVDLWKNKLEQKDAKYTHRLVMWDKDWNIKHISEPFSFMDGEIEFCCGLAEYKGDLLITFGFQDNAAYILKVQKEKLIDMLSFNWGELDSNSIQMISNEIFDKNIYEKYVKVKEGDVVMDVGSNVGAFTVSILNKNPLKVYCIEPSNTLIDVIKQNTQNKCVYINKAISDKTSTETIKEGVHIYCNEGDEYETITFKELIDENQIDKIDFLKIDCEGGEYDVFTEENKEWILSNVKHIAGELHLWGIIDSVNRFKTFRDTYLPDHKNYYILNAHTEEDITDKIFDNEFIQNYSDINTHSAQFLLYMTNN
jgi:FkbM family methyltransferase